MHPVPLVETTRGYPASGNLVENVHMGSVAVVDARGKLLWYAGNPHALVFTRSALKPFQALPFVLDDGPARFNLSGAELALLCASHSGEAVHLRGVHNILAKAGFDAQDLECGCAEPLHYANAGTTPPAHPKWSQLHHNCSGKHSGFLAWCRLHDVPSAGYVDPAHPLQQRIRSTIGALAGMPGDQLAAGMDGCSAPNYALPLDRLAQLLARLAQGNADPDYGAAMGALFDAMRHHPDMVSGSERSDLHYMQAGRGDWVSKIGADAVQTIGIASAGFGIAIKVSDGAKHVLHTATFSVLDQLGLLDAERRAILSRYRNPVLRNARGAIVGDIRASFTLHSA